MAADTQNFDLRLREINRLKKKLNFGNVPPFYHAVSTSLGLAEGLFRYGFENSLDLLLDQKNWNPACLDGKEDAMGLVTFGKTPRFSVYKVFTKQGFEIHCIPWLNGREVDSEYFNHPDMEFRHWVPATMKVLFRISQLHVFIQSYFNVGDDADLELIRYAHNISEDFINDLQEKLNVVKVHGISVKGFFDFVEKKHKTGEDFFLPRVYQFDE